MSPMNMAWGEFDEEAAPVTASKKRARKPSEPVCATHGIVEFNLRACINCERHDCTVGRPSYMCHGCWDASQAALALERKKAGIKT